MKKINVPELELKILRVLWHKEHALSVQDIIDSWDQDRLPGYTTVLKKLQIMEGKELVAHKKSGRSYIYYPLIKKSDVSQVKFNNLLMDLFGGDKLEMAAAFVKDTDLSEKDIDDLMLILSREKDV